MKIDHLLTTEEFFNLPTDSLGVPFPDFLEENLYHHITELSVHDFLLLQLVHQVRDLTNEIIGLQECIAPGRD